MAREFNYSLKERINFINGVALFKDTPDNLVKKIAHSLKYIAVSQGEAVFHKEDEMRALYIVIKGSLQVHDGNYIFSTFDKNDFFGEYSLIDEETRSASVTAITDSELFELSYETFNGLLEKEPQLAKSMLKGFVRRLRDNNIIEERLTKRTLDIQRQKNEIIKKRDELELQKKELIALNKTKDKFFSIIGHDLKNPFSTVIGLSELLINDFDTLEPERVKIFVEQIYKFSSNAYSLLDNLLQWARSQTGKLSINKNLYNLRDIIEENIDLLSGNAKQKNININFSGKSLYVHFDLNMISTVFRNLLSNAIKFTPEGGEIKVAYNEKPNEIIVSIHDSGIGISTEDQARLFKLDSNPTTIGTSNEKGTGLGLILANEFVNKHHGKIWVESQPGEGSIFKFTIPK